MGNSGSAPAKSKESEKDGKHELQRMLKLVLNKHQDCPIFCIIAMRNAPALRLAEGVTIIGVAHLTVAVGQVTAIQL